MGIEDVDFMVEENRDMLEFSMVLDLPTDQLLALGFEPKQMIADIQESLAKDDLMRNATGFVGGEFTKNYFYFPKEQA